MLTFLAILLISYCIAKVGIAIIDKNIEYDEREPDHESKERMTGYSSWIKGHKAKKIYFPKNCIDGEHSSVVLFDPWDRMKVDSVICGLCSDTLPTPAPLSCDACWTVNIDGYLHIEPCDKHLKEPILS